MNAQTATLAVAVIVCRARRRRGRAARPGAGRRARGSAPVDLTGYWVAVVSEDWRHRMATPRKGDYESLPLNAEGRRSRGRLGPRADNAAGLSARPTASAASCASPARLHITWQDDNDPARRVRRGHANAASAASIAAAQPDGEQDLAGPLARRMAEAAGPRPARGPRADRQQHGTDRAGRRRPRAARRTCTAPAALNEGGSLRVATTHFREGYLRKNGVPYSENAAITEYFHRLPTAAERRTVGCSSSPSIEDPKYLNEPFYTSTHFKLEPNGQKWRPTPCRTAPPPVGHKARACRSARYLRAPRCVDRAYAFIARTVVAIARRVRADGLVESTQSFGRTGERAARRSCRGCGQEILHDRRGARLVQTFAREILQAQVAIRVDRRALKPRPRSDAPPAYVPSRSAADEKPTCRSELRRARTPHVATERQTRRRRSARRPHARAARRRSPRPAPCCANSAPRGKTSKNVAISLRTAASWFS